MISNFRKKVCFTLFCWILFSTFPAFPAPAAQAELTILATTFPVWLFTRNITRTCPNIRVELLVPANVGCPHEYALSPRDRQKLADANVIVLNGLGMEDFLQGVLASMKGKTLIEAGARLAARNDGSQQESARGHLHGQNPHQFSSPARAAVMTRAIAEGLAGHHPANAENFLAASREYEARLTNLAARLADIGRRAPRRGIVLQHDSLSALARDAGLKELAVIEEEGQTPSAGALIALTGLIKRERPQLLGADPQYPDKTVVMLSKTGNVPYAKLNPGAMGPADAPLDWYETVMVANIQTLERYFVRP